jgi:hypothetical protein
VYRGNHGSLSSRAGLGLTPAMGTGFAPMVCRRFTAMIRQLFSLSALHLFMGIETIAFIFVLLVATAVIGLRSRARRRGTGESDTLPR